MLIMHFVIKESMKTCHHFKGFYPKMTQPHDRANTLNIVTYLISFVDR